MRCLLCGVLLLSSLAANGAEFHLKDGSVIIGKIVSLVDGDDLIVDTAYMDEVTIEWGAIETIRGTQVVDVTTFDNRRLIGTVTFEASGVTVSGDDEISVAAEDVFSIDELNETFWEGVEAYTDLGMNIVRGNSQVTQLSFGAGLGYDGRDFESSIDATTVLNEQTETTDTRRTTFVAGYTQRLGPRWQAGGSYRFESDEQQGLDGRSLFSGYFGYRLINSRRHRFDVYSGLAVNSEKFDGLERVETLEGLVGAIYRMRWAADLDMSLTMFPNLEESGRLRGQFDSTLSFDLLSDLDFKVTAYNRYDSDPPEGNQKNDTGFTLGLSWEY